MKGNTMDDRVTVKSGLRDAASDHASDVNVWPGAWPARECASIQVEEASVVNCNPHHSGTGDLCPIISGDVQ